MWSRIVAKIVQPEPEWHFYYSRLDILDGLPRS